jgi:hypothetical protein
MLFNQTLSKHFLDFQEPIPGCRSTYRTPPSISASALSFLQMHSPASVSDFEAFPAIILSIGFSF